jgi:hypothetical protein
LSLIREAVNAFAELIVDVGGGDHGDLALGSGPILDAVEDLQSAPSQEFSVALA